MLTGIPIVAGIIMLASGIVFHLQGRSVLGPTSSFMYSNPQWIDYGIYIILSGVGVLLFGTIMILRTR